MANVSLVTVEVGRQVVKRNKVDVGIGVNFESAGGAFCLRDACVACEGWRTVVPALAVALSPIELVFVVGEGVTTGVVPEGQGEAIYET